MPRVVKKCERCQRSFTTSSSTASFCSLRCYTGSGAPKGPAGAVETAICKSCGKPFPRYANRKVKRDICGRNCPARPRALTADRLYYLWAGMRHRAAKSKAPVCHAWASQYEAFRTWALSAGYVPKLILKRKDERLGYSPKNCEWVTKAEYLMRYGPKRFKTCEVCQRSFISYNPNAHFCSRECYAASGTVRGPAAAVEIANCKWCGKPFERFANRQVKRKLCGKDCPARPPKVTDEPLYSVWIAMKRRAAKFKVPVSMSWDRHYKVFRTWAFSAGYSPGLFLRRKDDNLGFSPQNCGWATRAQMQYSTKKRKNTRSRFKGVSWSKATGQWLMQIRKQGVDYNAFFRTEREAARAYDEKALELFGEFARLNFPRPKRTRQKSDRQR